METVKTLFIVGLTASGKSALSMELAQELGAEIVCADSQTIRRGMDIGTAKPNADDQKKVRHHLLDIIDPYEEYSAGQFKIAAEAAIKDINYRGKLAIIVGGTGLYIDSLYYDFSFDGPLADPELRALLSTKTVAQLQSEIEKKGLKLPTNSKNPRHLIRTLESGGMKALDKIPRPGSLIIGLDPGREMIKKRIAGRVDQIFDDGFIKEVQKIIKEFGQPSRKFDAIGYRIVMHHLESRDAGNTDETKLAVVTAESQFAKRQIAWFKRNPHIMWFNNAQKARQFVRTKIKT